MSSRMLLPLSLTAWSPMPPSPADKSSSLHTHSISPSLPPSSLLLRTFTASLNPSDINQIQGVYPSLPPFTSLLGTSEPSAVAGNEGCFEVLSVGSAIRGIGKGDWCIMQGNGFGTWRTHALAEERDVIRVEKEGVDAVQCGTVGVNGCSAYRMLRDYGWGEEGMRQGSGDWWIQNGGNSGVGRVATQLGRIWGLRSICVVRKGGRTEEQLESLRREMTELGADKVITDTELLDRRGVEEIKDLTGGKLKLGLNCVGGKVAEAMVKCLSTGGALVTYGGMAREPIRLPTSTLIFKDIGFSGFWLSRWTKQHLEEKTTMVHELMDLMRERKLVRPLVQEVRWDWDTKEEVLKEAAQKILMGGKAKQVFVLGDT